jgi:hypothetical protein
MIGAGSAMEHTQPSRIKHVQVLEIARLKEANKLFLAADHNLRTDGRNPVHIDSTRSHLNVILRGADSVSGITQKSDELMTGVLKKPRIDFVPWLEVVISLPSGTGIDESVFFEDAVIWAEGFFEVPILSAIIHNDEEKPHIHLLMLPLFQGRMIGSSLAKPNRYWVRHTDFNAKVGQRYGLSLPQAKTYHSAAARAAAADSVVMAMKSVIKNLEPAFWDAVRATLKCDPDHLMKYYGIEYPAKPKAKPKTFASIMAKPCKPEKTKALRIEKPKLEQIGKTKALHVQPEQEIIEALPVYGFADSISPNAPANAPTQDDYLREREEDQPAEYFHDGNFIKPLIKQKARSAEVERVHVALEAIRR